jgi:hypothetical protein
MVFVGIVIGLTASGIFTRVQPNPEVKPPIIGSKESETANTRLEPRLPQEELKTDFSPQGVLNEEQIDIVRQLALKSGLTSVGIIRTSNTHPGPGHCIIASQEEVLGRESWLTTVEIHYQHENWEPNHRNAARAVHRIGDFWTFGIVAGGRSRGGIYDYKGKQLRIRLQDDIQVAFGDPIAAAFATGKIRFENPEDQKTADKWRDGELTPVMIGEAAGKSCRVYIATNDKEAFMQFICTIEDDGTLKIKAVEVLIS